MIDADLQLGYDTPIGEYGKKLHFGGHNNADEIFISRYLAKNDFTELRVSIGDDEADKFVVGNTHYSNQNVFNQFFVVSMSGKVGINSPNPTSELEVNGTIKTKEIIVTNTGWADFVFKKDYKLRSLKEVESHIKQYASLPEMPTENEVSVNGIDLAKINVKLLQKVEELTLYIIQQEKKMQEQENRISKLENN